MQVLLSVLVAVTFAAMNDHGGHSKQMKLSEAPKKVQETLQREAGQGRIGRVEKEKDNGETIFEAEAQIDNREYTIAVREDGTLIVKSLEAHEWVDVFSDEDENRQGQMQSQQSRKDDEQEEDVREQDLPQAVRDTLKRETQGAQIEEIEREMKDGRTIYEAEFEMNGQEYEVMIAEDGTLLVKAIEGEGEDRRPGS